MPAVPTPLRGHPDRRAGRADDAGKTVAGSSRPGHFPPISQDRSAPLVQAPLLGRATTARPCHGIVKDRPANVNIR